MKLGFVNFTPLKYDVETPLLEPLGGSESAMCYLAVQMARDGHIVTLFRRNEEEFTKSGVIHKSVNKIISSDLDFLIIQNTPYFGLQIKERINPKTKLILWSQHASNQPAVECFKDKKYQDIFDLIILLSDWQIEDYKNAFNIDPKKIFKLRNAISPAFENIDINNKIPWSYCYTSTPFRGLKLLPELFEKVKEIKTNAVLKIYSSMNVYQTNEEPDYIKTYEGLKKIEGVTYIGSLPQKKLAEELSKIEYLSYPNIFAETSCISVMEAMACGCQIITTDLGALPETTAGFGKLIKITGNGEEYKANFVSEMIKPIDKNKIKKQVEFVIKNYTWKVRSKELYTFLETHV